jgi:Predicted periplasmic solute-binding protein
VEEKIRVGIVSYLNSRPLIYGLQRLPIKDKITLIEEYPALLADMLQKGNIDVGLVPVAIIPELPQSYICGNYCIGSVGDVASVALFSEVPVQQVETIYLDYQSRSSVKLLQWLVQHYWKINPKYVEAQNEDYIQQIRGNTAALIIGDRALKYRSQAQYIYDLAGEWKAATGLPFVFAAWVSSRPLPEAFIQEFDEANSYGLLHIDEIAQAHNNGVYDLKKYYSQDLSYELDAEKRKGLELFLNTISK